MKWITSGAHLHVMWAHKEAEVEPFMIQSMERLINMIQVLQGTEMVPQLARTVNQTSWFWMQSIWLVSNRRGGEDGWALRR